MITIGGVLCSSPALGAIFNLINNFNICNLLKKTIKAIILDLTVSNGMGGKDTIVKIKKINEKIPVFVASGYASDPILAEPEKYGFVAGIKKPFLISELSEILTKHIK